MTLFFILTEAEAKDRNIIPLISAFAEVESIGLADDILHAIEIIQQRCPDAAIFNERMLWQNPELALGLFKSEEGPLVVLPGNYGNRQRSVYIGVDLAAVDPEGFGWTVRSIRRLIETCHGKAAE